MTFAKFRTVLILAAGLLIFAVLHPAIADDTGATPPIVSPYGKLIKPIYNPETKSYFALVDITTPGINSDGNHWEAARDIAAGMLFKGVHGRLAIVKDIKIHEFFLLNFHPRQETWIGLRYLCARQQLQWADGTYWAPGSFQAWDANWKQSPFVCANVGAEPTHDWAPIAYTPAPEFRWIAKGWAKHFPYEFVEFPTGGP
jgi:hypothetical protein